MFDPVPLTAIQAQTLGTLIRLRFTAPDNYPCSAAALITALRQQSDPAASGPMEKSDLHKALAELVKHSLVRVLQQKNGFEYKQNASRIFWLKPAQLALLGALLLNGPLSAKELRRHAHRLYPFRDLEHVRNILEILGPDRTPALVRELPAANKKDPLYTHLFIEETELARLIIGPGSRRRSPPQNRLGELESRVAELEGIVTRLLKNAKNKR